MRSDVGTMPLLDVRTYKASEALVTTRLKEWCGIATYYEKSAASLMGVLCLAATVDRLKP
jgi:hypothetical protein